jgi:phosphoribosylglycinamide formyltransferase-1
MKKVKIAVLASGKGSNFQAIIDAIKARRCSAAVRVLITNNHDAKAIERAKQDRIPVEIVERKAFKTREELDEKIKELLDKYEVELVVLAGYMLLIKGKPLLESYKNRIINIHPALLPSFPGEEAQKQAFDYGVRISGVTIHFVDESLDGGPIIYQEAVDISDCNTAEEVAKRILTVEHEEYAKVIDSFAHGKYSIKGRKVDYTREE